MNLYEIQLQTEKHTSQEKDDNHRIDDREPVYLNISHSQVSVPPRSPAHITRLPHDLVRKAHFDLTCNNIWCQKYSRTSSMSYIQDTLQTMCC